MAKFEVEFWPGRIVEIELDDGFSEDTAFVNAIIQHGWPGGEEHTADGVHFQGWVRRLDE